MNKTTDICTGAAAIASPGSFCLDMPGGYQLVLDRGSGIRLWRALEDWINATAQGATQPATVDEPAPPSDPAIERERRKILTLRALRDAIEIRIARCVLCKAQAPVHDPVHLVHEPECEWASHASSFGHVWDDRVWDDRVWDGGRWKPAEEKK